MENFFETREQASACGGNNAWRSAARRLDCAAGRRRIVVSGGSTPGHAMRRSPVRRWTGSACRCCSATNAGCRRCTRTAMRRCSASAAGRTCCACGLAARVCAEYVGGGACADLNDAISTLNIPFACALIGMGEDGHFASLFPDCRILTPGLDVDRSTCLCTGYDRGKSASTYQPDAGRDLTRSDEIVLLFFGDDKRAVYEQAKHQCERLSRITSATAETSTGACLLGAIERSIHESSHRARHCTHSGTQRRKSQRLPCAHCGGSGRRPGARAPCHAAILHTALRRAVAG